MWSSFRDKLSILYTYDHFSGDSYLPILSTDKKHRDRCSDKNMGYADLFIEPNRRYNPIAAAKII